ncbi:hypothetical protein [Streptomyces sp. DHE17-7]|uniref:hypothetical protein n=1 Tax=Streptomyces sp. DHE17-7 TaxID=2759949 RepID=UPI0022EA2BA3|nr:hypothetical protein [Streptomyces sp. DHE17-7]MBJ6618022.1 hypothetical protein [Streptomyces sp. DHE17-7]
MIKKLACASVLATALLAAAPAAEAAPEPGPSTGVVPADPPRRLLAPGNGTGHSPQSLLPEGLLGR